jgi:hypothetical protein
MAVTAPSADTAGAAIDAQIAVLQALVNSTSASAAVYPRYQLELNQWQVRAVMHYMVTGWVNAAAILALYSAPTWDAAGQALAARVQWLQNLYNNAPAMPPGNAGGYGGSGWTTIASAFAQMLYSKQMELVEHIMDLPGGTSAATILANMTGSQTAPAGITFDYTFESVGYDDAWIDD